ncbi:hypothetical protein LF1_03540 [Rubripirellula obstinata]|uniref:Uncharacterized protein n=1 Tax=Rubripirellula obstinata TaxID=406547 RepID=A0A5B1CEU8_9BACT|nr:hypothetical protein LF1_03540 [Rubripirellula obstinata]
MTMSQLSFIFPVWSPEDLLLHRRTRGAMPTRLNDLETLHGVALVLALARPLPRAGEVIWVFEFCAFSL